MNIGLEVLASLGAYRELAWAVELPGRFLNLSGSFLSLENLLRVRYSWAVSGRRGLSGDVVEKIGLLGRPTPALCTRVLISGSRLVMAYTQIVKIGQD